MKSIVEIKLNRQITNVGISTVNSKTYEDIIDQILEDGGYGLIDVAPYNGNPDNHRDFNQSKLRGVTFVSLLMNLDENQINDFENHEVDIIEKALHILGKKYLDIVDFTEDDGETTLYFSDED